MSTTRLLADNIATLEQAAALIGRLLGEGCDFGARIGPHLRHVLDHYDCFFSGLASGTIDYDERARDPHCETQLAVACQRIASTAARLQALGSRELPAQIAIRVSTSTDGAPLRAESSPARELQFLQSHAVHHYALIAQVAAEQGLDFPGAFGKAPSTLRHEAGQAGL